MSMRAREVVELAFNEPYAFEDVIQMLRGCDEDDIDLVEQVGRTLTKAADTINNSDWSGTDEDGAGFETLEI